MIEQLAELRAELRELREMVGAVNTRLDHLHTRIDRVVDGKVTQRPGPPPRPPVGGWGGPDRLT